MSEGARQRLSRRAKLQGVDYAVLTSGQQIPEYSSSSESSGDDATYGGSSKRLKRRRRKTNSSPSSASTANTDNADSSAFEAAAKRKRKHKAATATPSDCFICTRASTSPFMQCEICARWYHYKCWKPFESASVLGNTSCHECVQGRTPTLVGSTVMTTTAPPAKPPLTTLQDFVTLLHNAKKILVVAGAGMSVSCGIPDFRSKDGIYAMLEHMDTHLPAPECVFQIEYFRQDPSPFFELVRNVFATAPTPSRTHRFLKLLQDKQKLLRLYSQNIDGLEEAAGVTRYIPCHGSFAWSRCMRCKHRVATAEVMDVIRAGVIPTCAAQSSCRGVLKPEITFFGELLSDHVSTSVTKDRLQADLLLVIGTSLKVSPVAEIPGFLPSHVPQVVINRTALKKKALKHKHKNQAGDDSGINEGTSAFDLTLLGDCDAIIEHLCDVAQWDLPPPATAATAGSTSESAVDVDAPRPRPRLQVIEHADKPNVLCFGECHCANTLDDRHAISDDDDDDPAPSSGFVCDGCYKDFGTHASTDGHYSCDECFDYDLCSACFATKTQAHFAGAHHFSRA